MIDKLSRTVNKSVTNKIILANAIVFLLTSIIPGLTGFFAMYNPLSHEFKIWQPLTHMFTHAGFLHIFFNMIVLYQFGNILENEINRFFRHNSKNLYLKAYIGFGLFAALTHIILTGGTSVAMVGASGAVSGVFSLYCLLYPREKVYLYFLIPIKCINMLFLFAGIELICALFVNDCVGHWAHLGGAFAGFLFWYTKFKKIQF